MKYVCMTFASGCLSVQPVISEGASTGSMVTKFKSYVSEDVVKCQITYYLLTYQYLPTYLCQPRWSQIQPWCCFFNCVPHKLCVTFCIAWKLFSWIILASFSRVLLDIDILSYLHDILRHYCLHLHEVSSGKKNLWSSIILLAAMLSPQNLNSILIFLFRMLSLKVCR